MDLVKVCRLAGLVASFAAFAGCAAAVGDPLGDLEADASADARAPVDAGRPVDARSEPDATPPEPDAATPDAAPPTSDIVSLALDDAFVDSLAPNTNFDTAVLEVDGDPNEKWALIKPRDLAGIPAGSAVVRATLTVNNFDGGSEYSVHSLTGAWEETTVTFATAPGLSAPIASVLGRIGLHSFDVTAVVQSWVDGAPAYGLGLHMVLDNGVDLHSTEAVSAADRPQLVVEFGPGT
jgi:hypothetical protein